MATWIKARELPSVLQWTVWVLAPVSHLISLMGGSNVAIDFSGDRLCLSMSAGYSAILILLFHWIQHRGYLE